MDVWMPPWQCKCGGSSFSNQMNRVICGWHLQLDRSIPGRLSLPANAHYECHKAPDIPVRLANGCPLLIKESPSNLIFCVSPAKWNGLGSLIVHRIYDCASSPNECYMIFHFTIHSWTPLCDTANASIDSCQCVHLLLPGATFGRFIAIVVVIAVGLFY